MSLNTSKLGPRQGKSFLYRFDKYSIARRCGAPLPYQQHLSIFFRILILLEYIPHTSDHNAFHNPEQPNMDRLSSPTALFAIALFGCACVCFLIPSKHVYDYFRDQKGLRRFPGMTILSPFTNIPYMFYASQKRRYKAVHEAHQKLGPVIRVGPNSVSFADVNAARDIYGHGSPVRKDHFYDVQAGSHRHLADVSDREDHSRKRRVLAGAYSQAGLERWEHIVADRTGALVRQYDRLCDRPLYESSPQPDPTIVSVKTDGFINHRQWMTIFAEDAIAQIGLTADLHLLEAGNDSVSITDLKGREHAFPYRAALWYQQRIQTCLVWSSHWYQSLRKLTAWHSGWRQETNYTNMCIHLVQTRLERYRKGEKLEDFFTYMLEDKYGNANMYPMGEFVAEVSIMLNAGSDTTAIALTNVLYWLLKNPGCFEKLRRELDDALDDDEDVAAYDKVKHLPYLRACLDESMRLTPPNTMNVPRLTPPGGMSIMGHWIAGDTTVHCSTYNMHRNPGVFPDSEAYKPERWLAEDARDLQPHFLTFSAGARGCIGRNITYLEQMVVLASLVHRYDFELYGQKDEAGRELEEDDKWTLKQYEAFTCSPGEMPVKIWRRVQKEEQ